MTVNSEQPGQHRRTQLLEKSFIDLNDNNLFENTLTYGSDVPVDIIGLSKTTSSLNTHHLISSGTFNQVDSLFDSPLSDITNVIGNPRHNGQRRGSQVQIQNLTDRTPSNAFIDLNFTNLVENTLTYDSDVPLDKIGLSKTPLSINTPPMILSESSNNPSKHASSDIETHYLPSSISHHIAIPVEIVGVIENLPLPINNISRRSRRSVIGLRFDENMIDHPPFPSEYVDLGDASYECRYCDALFWLDERLLREGSSANPNYSGCCQGGIVDLPRLLEPPVFLSDLLHGNSSRSKHFQENITSYNSMFCFSSMGDKIDHDINKGSGPRIFRLHGQNYHLIDSLLPENGTTPKFAQMYIYDTENEVSHRKNSVRGSSGVNNLCEDIIVGLKHMLDDNNKLVKTFRMAKDKIQKSCDANVRVRLIGKRQNSKEERSRNLPTFSEVAVLVVGDFDNALGPREIVVELKSGKVCRINELNISFLALQYPLLLPYDEDGFTEDIPFTRRKNITEKGRKNVSVREYFAFRLHDRKNEASTILSSRRLFQQFIVDAYTMVETCRLNWVYLNQKKFRDDIYKGLEEAVVSGDCDPKSRGKRIILPSTFTGGSRYMIQNYQDAMAICRTGWLS
ncbi:hypothetical protein CASFOL_037190 [Castilleja foliolosa]|uniref:Helitron helicase-like domain-containing protein n=1 Tax=Castilleja foliolosa TaxID=1961234 RepID=A0ABD3BQG9_9LAMI